MKHNHIVRHEKCASCKVDIPVWNYVPYNHDDYNRVISAENEKKALCIPCWNALVNDHIQFDQRGWVWDGTSAQDAREMRRIAKQFLQTA